MQLHGPAAMLLEVHERFRRATDALVEQPGADRRHLFRRLLPVLRHHHHAEEIGLFPFVRRRTEVSLQPLFDDHTRLDDAIAEAAGRLAHGDPTEALIRLRDVLHDHLDREETIVLPVLTRVPPERS
ncbi:MAG: hemerythrin domain-containing protein [Myxococcota bacterium]